MDNLDGSGHTLADVNVQSLGDPSSYALICWDPEFYTEDEDLSAQFACDLPVASQRLSTNPPNSFHSGDSHHLYFPPWPDLSPSPETYPVSQEYQLHPVLQTNSKAPERGTSFSAAAAPQTEEGNSWQQGRKRPREWDCQDALTDTGASQLSHTDITASQDQLSLIVKRPRTVTRRSTSGSQKLQPMETIMTRGEGGGRSSKAIPDDYLFLRGLSWPDFESSMSGTTTRGKLAMQRIGSTGHRYQSTPKPLVTGLKRWDPRSIEPDQNNAVARWTVIFETDLDPDIPRDYDSSQISVDRLRFRSKAATDSNKRTHKNAISQLHSVLMESLGAIRQSGLPALIPETLRKTSVVLPTDARCAGRPITMTTTINFTISDLGHTSGGGVTRQPSFDPQVQTGAL